MPLYKNQSLKLISPICCASWFFILQAIIPSHNHCTDPFMVQFFILCVETNDTTFLLQFYLLFALHWAFSNFFFLSQWVTSIDDRKHHGFQLKILDHKTYNHFNFEQVKLKITSQTALVLWGFFSLSLSLFVIRCAWIDSPLKITIW